MAHGIMFHHFHGGNHPPGQGSISAEELRKMVRWLRSRYEILNAQDFYNMALARTLTEKDICLTFDDSLRCQYDIAAPVLAEEGLTAFYFCYSSAFTDHPDMLEVYRFFRSTEYPDFDSFCDEFMKVTSALYEAQIAESLRDFDPDSYLKEFPFYSTNDRIFRYVRDRILSSDQYAQIMNILIANHSFDVTEVLPRLFMSAEHLVELRDQENVIGLHSHSHPINMEALSPGDQYVQYASNHAYLQSILAEAPTSMSHPMGRYTSDTLQILSDLGVLIGFRSSLSIPRALSLLEIPREDHANVLKRMSA